MVGNHQLAARLLGARERWGWEYVVPAPPAPSPVHDCAPQWLGFAEPRSLERFRGRVRGIPLMLGAGVLTAAFATVLAASWGLAWWPVAAGVVLAPVAAWSALAGMQYATARRLHETRAAEEWSRFETAMNRWKSQVAEHDRREQERLAAAVRWYPVQPERDWNQVTVFGGTADGWSSLLATLGLSLLSTGSTVLILDFTERGVAAELATLAGTVGYGVRVDRVPRDGVVGVADLPSAQAGEMVAEVLAAMRGSPPDAARVHAVDAELVEAVHDCLEPPRTFRRIAAGLSVLRRTFDTERHNSLSGNEIRRLNRITETLGSLAEEELRFLTAALRLLGDLPAAATLEPVRPRAGLRVVATADPNARRKHLLDGLVFARTMHEVRAGAAATPGAVVVAGADRLDTEQLEALARHTGRAGLRLITMSEHLRGEHTQLLGAAGSAALLMRLGNAAEAAAAADFVGRGHRFVLSQLTEQIGRSFTDGISDTTGDSVTSTVTDNYAPTSAGSSDSHSRAATWSQTTSWSRAENTSTGRTWARAYEYLVEPTTFQSLPATAFVWVENEGHGRRVVAGDCNPGIALLDRVAAAPRTATAASC